MKKNEQTRVILPLYVEESTGAGLYLMGRDNIPETRIPRVHNSFPCYPCVVRYEECARERKIEWGSTGMGIPMDDRRMIFYLSVKAFFRVAEAVEFLKHLEEKGGLKYGYRMDNAAMEYDVPPEGLDAEFSSFFYKESPQILSREDLSKEDRDILEKEDREEETVRRREEARRRRAEEKDQRTV